MIQAENQHLQAHKLIRLTNFFASITIANFFSFLIDLMHANHISKISMIVLMAMQPFVLLITSIIVTNNNYFQMRKKIVIIGLLLQSASYFIFAYVHNQKGTERSHEETALYPLFYMGRILQSLGVALMTLTFYSYMAIIQGTTISTDRRFGFLEASTLLGYIFCPFIRDLIDYLDYEKWTLVIFGVLILICSILFHYLFPILIETKTENTITPLDPLITLFKSREIQGSVLLIAGAYFGVSILLSLLPNNFSDNIGILLAVIPWISILITLLISVMKKNDRKNYFTLGSIFILIAFTMIGPENENEDNVKRMMYFFGGLLLLAFAYPFIWIPSLQELINQIDEVSENEHLSIQPVSDCAVALISFAYSLGMVAGVLFERLYMDHKDKNYYQGLVIYMITFGSIFFLYFCFCGGKSGLLSCCKKKRSAQKKYVAPIASDLDTSERSVEIQEIRQEDSTLWHENNDPKAENENVNRN